MSDPTISVTPLVPPLPPKKSFRPFHTLWRSVRHVATVLGFLLIFSLIVGAATSYYFVSQTAPDLPERLVLFFRIDGSIPEGPAEGLHNPFGSADLTLSEAIDALEAGAKDERVQALVFSVRQSSLGLSQIEELRRAVTDFRETSGKPAYVFSISYGEAGQGLSVYTLASAFDEIWMQPLGVVSVGGVRLEQPYMRALLERIGVQPQFYQREEYKGLFESATRDSMSPETKESLGTLIKSISDRMVGDILASRQGLAKAGDFQTLIDQGLFTDEEALKAGLIDRLDYGDVLLRELRHKLEGSDMLEKPALVPLEDYYLAVMYDEMTTAEKDVSEADADTLAVIHIQGPIMILSDDDKNPGLLGGASRQSADDIADLIFKAGKDPDIKGIVLRVDSPGGSPTASELIRRAVLNAQSYGKPVVVSMGGMAASGGYWVSAPADRIFALPATITGSIGVAGGKVSVKQLWANLDVNWETLATSDNTGFNSINAPFSKFEEERINAMMDRTYAAFLKVVAEGRDLSPLKAREVAKGRVWSGADALKVGLVDELGGLNEALDYVARETGHKGRHDVDVIMLPEPKTFLEEILDLMGQSAALSPFLQWQARVMQKVDAAIGDDVRVMQNGSPVMVYDPLRF